MASQLSSSFNLVYSLLSSLVSGFGSTCTGGPCSHVDRVDEIELLESVEGEEEFKRNAEHFEIIKLLSYNVFIRPPAPKFTHNVVNDYKDQRLNSFIDNYLEHYDVICLQEMFGAFSRRRKRLIRSAHKKGFLWKVSSPQERSSMYLVDGGCLILSRVRIVAEASTIFQTAGKMADRLAAKGVIYAKLNPKPGVYVHLFVTHLQALYPGSSTVQECMDVQRNQYEDLVDFVSSTVAENESPNDMLVARRLLDRKKKAAGGHSFTFGHTVGVATPPNQDTMGFLAEKCRRWPIVLAGDFNCNSRPIPGDVVSKTTKSYLDLCHSLSKVGEFADILFDQIGEHPVTYAAADFSLNGSFSPREIALTCPTDYHKSGEYVNQSLDNIFLFPPTHEFLRDQPGSKSAIVLGSPVDRDGSMSPDSRAIQGSVLRPVEVQVRHLDYVPHPAHQAGESLRYLSDHMALEAVLQISPE